MYSVAVFNAVFCVVCCIHAFAAFFLVCVDVMVMSIAFEVSFSGFSDVLN